MGIKRQEASDKVKARFISQFRTDTGRGDNARLDPRWQVTRFAESMEAVLRDNDHKGGWGVDMCSVSYLEDRLIQEMGEYFKNRDIKELIDIANFAMMIWDRLNPSYSGAMK